MSHAEAIRYFQANSGYARMKALKERGVHPRVIRSLLGKGVVEKIKPGMYRLITGRVSEHQKLVDVTLAVPKGIICIYSALYYYKLCDVNPEKIMVAVPQGCRMPKLTGSIQPFFFSRGLYDIEITEVRIPEGSVRIYSREKALVDAFRFKSRFGLEPAQNALCRYVRSRHRYMGRLLLLARNCRVLNQMMPFLDGVM